ncbi:nickel-dependent hydrogenase large subunit [Desulfotalea psychrophila]|uniref:Related to cytochrome-c3 hydrogenase (NiFeSe), large subunit n=1 Tax=Desulfotalea psychrophila (strain LSv54 / DSM 12343) TaxID=177439 RepID=Q6ARY7_DESPS|nr:nickel-dependent hydrogenase large subunit [Desulfotalea psychrophila]CAG34888.1 related to cytochrome-c3 hydrogenase (NiFeSe), large subunit [Desulfotalea psychrophila LSv54]
MSSIVKLDPFTRIEGHLAVSLNVQNNRVKDAQCTGEMVRGFEQILQGRSPLDAQQIVQRICGVCPVSHGIASVLAQEQAYGIQLPENARLQRNIMLASNYIQSHITHFYHLSALDFIDITAILDYKGGDAFLLAMQNWVKAELASKNLFPAAPFLPRYQGRYLKDVDFNITALRNYFIALEMRATAHQLIAIFAGKMPHMASIVPGGITEKVTTKKIIQCKSKLAQLKGFINNSYRNDLLAITAEFPSYLSIGKSCGNFLSFGAFGDANLEKSPLLPAGALLQGKLEEVDDISIKEDVSFSKYSSDSGREKTVPEPHKSGAYSWIKAPRYRGEAMEVGPLARLMVAQAKGNKKMQEASNAFLQKTDLSLTDLDSCLGRHIARFIELEVIIEKCEEWMEQLRPDQPTAVDFNIPQQAEGRGMMEAPRGALGHWVTIEKQKIGRYECIVPTTWNCSPKDDKQIPGPVEQSLIGTIVADKTNPLEAARIVRSYDPCLACAVH